MNRKLSVALAGDEDRRAIYAVRHDVYASELGQHPENSDERLTDAVDSHNIYIKASVGGRIAGFISITPPGHRYSVDKYLPRDSFPFPLDDSVYEIRLLTVIRPLRGWTIAALLMYAALRWVESQGGKRIIAIGRREVLSIYLRVGLRPLGRSITSGAVTFELLTADTEEIRSRIEPRHLRRLAEAAHWELDIPFYTSSACFHGGAFFNAVGVEFDDLSRRKDIINADVLDAWFPPSPKVVEAIQEHLPWILRTSPPVDGAGMIAAISHARSIDPSCILPGAGSSDLLFLALREWLTPRSKVLILDPTYGEYAHLLEHVIRCRVDRFRLSEDEGYQVDLLRLYELIKQGYELVVLVNPNNPTGQHIPKDRLITLLKRIPRTTRAWIDEAYVDYVGKDQSLESFAAQTPNVVVCKSMSKAYALSGTRVAYLCASQALIRELRPLTPPWAVSLIGQIAAVKALEDDPYYTKCYEETHQLRDELIHGLRTIEDLKVFPGVANFVLCALPPHGPDADTVDRMCRAQNLFVRNVQTMGQSVGDCKIRIAVKDRATNQKMIHTLANVMRESRESKQNKQCQPLSSY